MLNDDANGDASPQYSRPPSSTFRGYSFMNFRNDSVSSTDQNQNTFTDAANSSPTSKLPL